MDILICEERRIYVLGCVNGLLSEGSRVRLAVKKTKPSVIGIPTSPEELVGLGACCKGKVQEMVVSNLDEIYAKNLKQYGEVQVPPPFMVTAWRMSRKQKIPLKALDMDEDKFADVWVDNVSTVDLVIHSNRVRRLKRKKFKVDDPQKFVVLWDREINKTGGYMVVELEREKFIAESIFGLWKKNRSVLAAIEVERKEGIIRELMEKLPGKVTRKKMTVPYPEKKGK